MYKMGGVPHPFYAPSRKGDYIHTQQSKQLPMTYFLSIMQMPTNINILAGIRSAAASRVSREPETLNSTHKTDKRMHITQTKGRTCHGLKPAHKTDSRLHTKQTKSSHNTD